MFWKATLVSSATTSGFSMWEMARRVAMIADSEPDEDPTPNCSLMHDHRVRSIAPRDAAG
eukprot:5602322-Prorocentrum_lima.AAC.1